MVRNVQIDIFAFNILFLEQSLDSNIKGFFVEDFLGLSQTVSCNMSFEGCQHTLQLRHVAKVSKSMGVVVQSNLALTQHAHPHGATITIVDFLFIWHEAIVNPTGQVRPQSLALSQSVDVQSAKGVYASLALQQSVSLTITRNVTVEQTLVLGNHVADWKPSVSFYSFPIVIGGGIDG